MGFAPLFQSHDNFDKVSTEIKNIETQVQDKQFRTFDSTPTLTDLEDHEMVLVSSNGYTAIMFRDNIEIYAVQTSCVTVKRGD